MSPAGVAAVARYALLVGANDGGSERVTLRYAHDDAHQMATVLADLGGVDPEHEWVVLDPDEEQLAQAFDVVRQALQDAPARTEFVFYYSGHSDEDGLLLGDERFRYADLRSTLDGLPAQVRLAILDSCASGALILSKGGRSVAPFLVDASAEHEGFAYLTSSSADEVAQEAERIGGSYFTHYLTAGLRGAADVSGDGRVTLNEAYSYANAETLQRTQQTQHGPQHARYETQLSGTGDYVLTDLALVSSTLVLDEGLAGDVMVRDADGALVVELPKEEHRAVALGLPAGRFVVSVAGADGYGEAGFDLDPEASVLVGPGDFAWRAEELAVARGDAPAAVVVPGPLATLTVQAQIVPGLPAPDPRTTSLLVGLGAASAPSVQGLGLALGYVGVGEQHGTALAFGAVSARQLDGVQVAGLGTVAGASPTWGGQLSMGFNTVGSDLEGGQLTMGVNVVDGMLRGAQLSMGVNAASGGLRGLQTTMGLNYAGGTASEGVQLAGINVAGGLGGAQIGLINVGRNVTGAQIGLVNVAGEVTGTQIGLVNVARDVKGTPFGVVSVEKEGRHDVLAFGSESDPANAELRFGGDYLYTLVGVGGSLSHAYGSFGLGVHAPMGHQRLWLDLDGLGAAYLGLGQVEVRGGEIADGPLEALTPVVRARATFGFQVLPQLAPFVGISVNGKIPMSGPRIDVAPDFLAPGEEIALWPGAFAGLQF
ncbi:MAG: caspase family protein [Myxococcota bacterium]